MCEIQVHLRRWPLLLAALSIFMQLFNASPVPQSPFDGLAMGAMTVADAAQSGAAVRQEANIETPFISANVKYEVGAGDAIHPRNDDSSDSAESDERRRKRRRKRSFATFEQKTQLDSDDFLYPISHMFLDEHSQPHLHRDRRSPCGYYMRPTTPVSEDVEEIRRRQRRRQQQLRRQQQQRQSANNKKTTDKKSSNTGKKTTSKTSNFVESHSLQKRSLVGDQYEDAQIINMEQEANTLTKGLEEFANKMGTMFDSVVTAVRTTAANIRRTLVQRGEESQIDQ